MSDHDVDDIAFLTGSPHESGFLVSKRAMYEPGSVMVCSQKRACVAVSFGFLAIISVAVIVAFTKPGCPEATYVGEPISGFEGSGSELYAVPPLATNGEEFPWNNIKLPIHIQPLHYYIFIHPNLTTSLLKGNVSIVFTAVEETKLIVLHARGLNISHYSLKDKYKQSIKIIKFLVYPTNQQIYFGLSNILHRGSNYTLNLIFSTSFRDNLDGFYLSSYKDEEGNKRLIGATHFEPTSARSAFPCFDEPQMKARFQLSIVREEHQFSLFNMPLDSSSQYRNTDLVIDNYLPSVEMSSYLVAFVICDFENVTKYTTEGVRVSIFAPSTMINQANYALAVTIKILEYYEDFFQVSYPLPKQDLIAIPNFAAGAMENWGLITYKENSLMFEPDQTSARAQQSVTAVIAHELAHQWFGNLVTMNWWQDIWLNEGFASFMESIGTDIAEPGWAMSEQFIIEKVQPALELDGLLASHPISQPVNNPADIEALFDAISYKKGAAIISMLEICVGRKVLQDGLRKYLNDHRYGNAETDQLWQALTESATEARSSLNVKEVMDTWILQAGYPLISVRIGSSSVNATQARFLECFYENATDPNAPLNHTLGYKWHVPLTYISSSNKDVPKLIWMNMTDVEFEIPKDITWIKFNVGQRGLYRVIYDNAGWEMLTNLLLSDPKLISAADRASIIDDSFTLARGSRLDVRIPLDLSIYLRNETAYAPWHTALTHLLHWADLLFYHHSHTLLMSYIRHLILPQYIRLGWNDTGSHLDKLLRSEILMTAVDCRHKEAVEIAMKMFRDYRTNNITVAPNLRYVVYSAGVRHGTEDDWRFCWKLFTESTVPSEKRLLITALAQTRDPWLMQQYLEYALTKGKIRTQDVMTVLMEIGRNAAGQLGAWRMVRKNWDHIWVLFGRGSFSMGTIIKSVTSHFTSDFDLNEVNDFFHDKDVGSGVRALEQALETVRLNIQWQKDNVDGLRDWLSNLLKKQNLTTPIL